MRLRTERLLLRPWCDEDLAPFRRLNADRRVMEHFPAPLSAAQSDELGERIRTSLQRDGYGLWAAEEIASSSFVGFIGLSRPRFEAPFMPCVEVGWRLAHEFWGRGYATEGARAAADIAFTHLRLDELVSMTTVANTRSRRVMEKLGMTHDPADDFEHPLVAEGSPIRPHVLYRLGRP
jgi:ribosomal-protein-alanine N-acetyltransferase